MSARKVRLGTCGSLAALAALSFGAAVGTSTVSHVASATPATAAGPYVRLARGAHPLARPELDVGPLDPTRRIENLSLVFKLSPEQLRQRDALRAALIDQTSPSYHQWLTPESYAARFGAGADDLARATSWLTEQGLEVRATSRLGARVTFAGTVAKLEAAFHTEMRRYRVGSETHFAMASAPAIPTELADIVLAIHNTHDFYPRPAVRTRGPHGARVVPAAVCPDAGYCATAGVDGLAPPDWATVYDVSPLYTTGIKGAPVDGSGVTIAVVGIAEIAPSDIAAFRTRYGLSANPLTTTLVPNTGAPQGDNGAGMVAILDTEWAGGIAPNATVNYVYTGASDGNVNDATYYAIEQNFGGVLDESWGSCEAGDTPADADVTEVFGSAANVLGITYLAATGDDGATACIEGGLSGLYVNMPASFPGVTAVGGTQFPLGASLTFPGGNAAGYSAAEAVWNESNDPNLGVFAGGGGISVVFSRPTYQVGIADCDITGSLPVTGLSNMRQVPDVALTAATGGPGGGYGYFIECTLDLATQDCAGTGGATSVVEIGGTSASTPSFAGVVALASQATGGRLGNINPLLYALQSSTPAAFHDIETGNNEVVCQGGTDTGCPSTDAGTALYGYAAAAGYDCASGLGSINATTLVGAIAALPTTTTTLVPVMGTLTEGETVSLTATVGVVGTSASALGGTVTFAFQSYLANGQHDLSWTLGTAAITSGTATGGVASPPAFAIPPGMVKPGAQEVDVVAMYGGDATHLPSTSAKMRVSFAPVSLCVTPGTASLAYSAAAGSPLALSAAGGVSPVKWYVDSDTTCNAATADGGDNCSTLAESTGAFVAGTGQAGYVVVVGIDSDGAEAFSEVTVGTPTGTAPWALDAGIVASVCGPGVAVDAGADGGGPDSGAAAGSDGGLPSDAAADANGGGPESVSGSGCGCTIVGNRDSAPASFLGILLGLGLLTHRRRARQ